MSEGIECVRAAVAVAEISSRRRLDILDPDFILRIVRKKPVTHRVQLVQRLGRRLNVNVDRELNGRDAGKW